MSNKTSAGILLLLIAIMPIGIWVIYLNVANPTDITWKENLKYLLSSENELQLWFYASVVSGVVSLIASITYFTSASNSKSVLMLLLSICTLQALPAIWSLAWDLKFVYSLPVIFGYLAYKNPNNSLNQIGAKKAPPG